MNECRGRLESTVNSGKRRNRSDIIVKKFLRLHSQWKIKTVFVTIVQRNDLIDIRASRDLFPSSIYLEVLDKILILYVSQG